MTDVSKLRFIVLRCTYAFIAIGQTLVFWPKLLAHSIPWALNYGDAGAMLAATAIPMAFGIRYPLKMLPIMLYEFTWKVLWIAAIYVPIARAGQVDAATRESMVNVTLGVIVCGLAIPWGYVWKRYVVERAESTLPAA